MTLASPPVDPRRQAEVAAQLRAELTKLYPGWPSQGDAGNALAEVFARYAGIVIERINRVPDRTRAAFLSQIGGALLPPQPATVPLTFTLAPGGSIAAVVEKGTQVAAAPMQGSTQSVVFETDADLIVTAAKLDCLFVRTAATDRFSDLSPLLSQPVDTPLPVYTGSTPLEHTLYIGSANFIGVQPLNFLSISFSLEEGLPGAKNEAVWEIWTGTQAIPVQPEKDGTEAFVHTGEVTFRSLPVFAEAIVDGRRMHWLRCRLLKAITQAIVAHSVTFEREIDHTALLPEAAFTNSTVIDLTKDFHPLGEQPKFGDTFYLLNARAFGVPGAKLTLDVTVTNPADAGSDVPVPRVNATGHAQVAWECWSGRVWTVLGTMSTNTQTGDSRNDAFCDTTQAFTRSGQVSFTLPANVQPATVAGVHGPWLRARLVANNYGEPAGYTATEHKPGTTVYVYKPPTLVTPILKTISVSIALHEVAQTPDTMLAYNDFAYNDVSAPLSVADASAELFRPSADAAPALYLGFQPPFGLAMPSTTITVFFVFGSPELASAKPNGSELQRIAWEYWDGERWSKFGVVDQTGGFLYSGRISFLVPTSAKPSSEFGQRRYWLRVSWHGGARDTTAPLRAVLENTISGSQVVTLTNEVLGSSNGTPDQNFASARQPVLEGELLQVRSSSRENSQAEEWVTWSNVLDFHASGPLDTHYVIDRLAGTVQFGDSDHGSIPPIATGNVRLTRYRTGGGALGNRPAGTIVLLKTTVPYIKAVTNLEAASGGADAETTAAMLERAPRSFRHRARAVTVEDYEDLALLASPEVARARCVPLANLITDPDAKQMRPGVVSVIIVPRSPGGKPRPSQSLLRRVTEFIESHQSATVQLVVSGPEYIELDVTAEIAITTVDGVTELELALHNTLLAFMHSLTGGFDGKGWDFGRHAHRSDLFSLLSSNPQVDHLRRLTIHQNEQRCGAAKTGNFLACPGEVSLTFTLV